MISPIKGLKRQYNYLHQAYPKPMRIFIITLIGIGALIFLLSLTIGIVSTVPFPSHIAGFEIPICKLLWNFWSCLPFVLGGQALVIDPIVLGLMLLGVYDLLREKKESINSTHAKITTSFFDRLLGRESFIQENDTEEKVIVYTENIKKINNGKWLNQSAEKKMIDLKAVYIFKDRETRDYCIYYGRTYHVYNGKDNIPHRDVDWKNYETLAELIKDLNSDAIPLTKKKFEALCEDPENFSLSEEESETRSH